MDNFCDDEGTVLLSADQLMRAVAEDTISSLEVASSLAGKIHRLTLESGTLPSAPQLHYLEKAWDDLGSILTFLRDMSTSDKIKG